MYYYFYEQAMKAYGQLYDRWSNILVWEKSIKTYFL